MSQFAIKVGNLNLNVVERSKGKQDEHTKAQTSNFFNRLQSTFTEGNESIRLCTFDF
jgi:hypothetical protein